MSLRRGHEPNIKAQQKVDVKTTTKHKNVQKEYT